MNAVVQSFFRSAKKLNTSKIMLNAHITHGLTLATLYPESSGSLASGWSQGETLANLNFITARFLP